MSEDKTPKKRRRKLKPQYRGGYLKLKIEIIHLRRQVAEMKKILEGGWVSDDGVWCDIVYAARRIGKREQTLRNMKSKGEGPMVYAKSGSLRYKLADLDRFLETGWGLRHAKDDD